MKCCEYSPSLGSFHTRQIAFEFTQKVRNDGYILRVRKQKIRNVSNFTLRHSTYQSGTF
jgi:hypothetical protein